MLVRRHNVAPAHFTYSSAAISNDVLQRNVYDQ